MKWIYSILLLLLCAFSSYAAEYFVGGPNASDNNPGTSSQPFATIQKAASVAKAGDIVTIRSGTYRETIVPANSGGPGSPIVFRAAPGAKAVISGLNTAEGGWSVHKGNIYKKSITLPVDGYNLEIKNNTTLLANQVFKDGVMMFEARWPKLNKVEDLLDRDKNRLRSNSIIISGTSTTDSAIPNIEGGWVGGTIWIQGWYVTNTRTITSHSAGRVGYNNVGSNDKYRRYYYLTGKLGALTQEKEWHYQSGTLYFWQPGGGPPTGVEYKARNWGFDLTNKSYITIEGLEFFGCTPMNGNTNSKNVVIDGIRAKYMNHAVLQQDPDLIYHNAKQTGIKLIGENSVIRNSELQWAASQAVWLGERCIAENNLITDISYEGNYGAGITLWDRTGNQVIRNNTIARTGRSGIDFGYVSFGQHLNVEIAYNDIYNFGMLNVDLGGIYGARMVDLTGTRIHHNWIHDSKATNDAENLQLGINTGIYFDQASGPSTCDHNVLWNNVQSDIYTQPTYGGRSMGPSRYINNTLITNAGNGGNRHSYKSSVPSPVDIQRNNIYRDDIIVALGRVQPDVANSLLNNSSPQFVGTGGGGLAYRLKAGSPGIDQGTVIKGITDDAVGVPDIGAYEFGGKDWVPGYSPKKTPQVEQPANVLPNVNIVRPGANNTFDVGNEILIEATATDTDGTIKKVEFYQGNIKLGEDATSPYTFSWNNAAAGTYVITAKATDNDNGVKTSGGVTITVKSNSAPEVNITAPANNATFASGASVTITATASDSDGTITKVEFFNGSTKLGEATKSPYTFVWNNPPAGKKTLTARATDNTNLSTASKVVNITVGTNSPPVTSITSPSNNSKILAGSSLTISANATDANGSVKKVEFFADDKKLGEDVTAPYSLVWSNVPEGKYVLTVKATDNQGSVTTSAPVNIVSEKNAPPTVSITSPSNNAKVLTGASVTITANASDSDGSIKKVEFFAGDKKLGEDATAPYSFAWSNVPTGKHVLTVKATDNNNSVTTSAAVNIVAETNSPPVVSITSPSNNTSVLIGASVIITANASDSNGTIKKVEFFAGNKKLGEDTTAPYSFAWNNIPEGKHVLTVKATDNDNSVTTSAPVNIVAATNSPPVVEITTPANNTTYEAGQSIVIQAVASDEDGKVIRVEFYNGNNKIGEDTSSPYSFTWNNAPKGEHIITAKAFDDENGTASSKAVTITVSDAEGSVVITSPTADEIFSAGDNINVTVNATIAHGSITKVEFYDGSVKIGEDTSSPYEYTITNIENGEHVITVVAIDNLGNKHTSAPITISIPDSSDAKPDETLASLQSAIPRFFSPNDDGIGDYWEWGQIDSFDNAQLIVFNRAGQTVYETSSYKNNWDGKINGQPVQPGDYYYVVRVNGIPDIKGSVRIIR